jgi:2-oxoglutarate dehydrogenase E2 component (dihydrolipoamide succinyltransferase)
MPQLGESVVEGTVGKWLKSVGDPIALYEPIMEVVTDKVTTEIPAPAAGVLAQILVQEGTTVKAGTVVALIGELGETTAPESGAGAPQAAPTPSPAAPPASMPTAPAARPSGSVAGDASPKSNGSARNRLTPVVARMISEFNITDAELASIVGTGENGRISKKDLENLLRARQASPAMPAAPPSTESLPPWEQPGTGELFRPTEEVFGRSPAAPQPPTSPKAPREIAASAPSASADSVIPLSPMRRSIAEHMVRSKTIAPHVTTVHEADMSRVLAFIARHQDEFARQNVKLTYTPFFLQAVVAGLRQVPLINAQFTEQGVVMKRDLNLGIAVAMDDGLIVPVIKHADDKSLLGLARAVNDLAERARAKKLAPDEVTGGTFTLTNYGIFGSLFGTPVISQPQSAILGVGAIQKRVVVINDAIAIRPMVYLALSFDHRLLDGAIGDTFMKHVKDYLEHYGE